MMLMFLHDVIRKYDDHSEDERLNKFSGVQIEYDDESRCFKKREIDFYQGRQQDENTF